MNIKSKLFFLLLVISFTASATDYAPIQLQDLKVDIKSMTGKHIVTKGGAQSFGDTTLLKDSAIDMNPIQMSVDSLPREDRKKLANGCQMILCSGVFYGTINKGALGPELKLEKVTWK